MPARATSAAPIFVPSSDRSTNEPSPVLRATPSDLAYAVHLQKRHGDAIGFLPRAALEQKIDLGRVWLARENGQPAGFLHHGSLRGPEVRIFQAAVQYDARRRHLGWALVADLLARARAAGARGVSLRCLSYLDANEFWTAAGFRLLTTEPGAKGTLNVWVKELADLKSEIPNLKSQISNLKFPIGHDFAFASRVHACPRCGAPTTDTWTRGARRRRLCPTCVGNELTNPATD